MKDWNDDIQVRSYMPGDETRLLRLFEKVWGTAKTLDHWKWQFREHVQGRAWISIAEIGGKIVGQNCVMQNHLNHLGEEYIAGQSCDSMVDQDYRRRKVRAQITECTFEKAEEMGVHAVFGFPNRISELSLARYHNWNRIAELKFYSFRLGFGKLRKIWGTKVDNIFKGLLLMPSIIGGGASKYTSKLKIEIMNSSYLPDNLDTMLRESMTYEILSVWKDLNYLRWRYEKNPTHKYQFHILSSKGEPQALIICRLSGESLLICDVIHRTKDIGETVILLRHVMGCYRKSEVRQIIFYGHDNGFFDSVFKGSGFRVQPRSGMVFGGLVLKSSRLERIFLLPHNWTIAYGDSDWI